MQQGNLSNQKVWQFIASSKTPLTLLVELLQEQRSEDMLTQWLPGIKPSAELRHHLTNKPDHSLSTPVSE